MKNVYTRIFSTAAVGGILGALIALQFEILWILGVLIGAITSFILYDLKGFIQAIPAVWKKTRESLPLITEMFVYVVLVLFRLIEALIVVVVTSFILGLSAGLFLFYMSNEGSASLSIYLVSSFFMGLMVISFYFIGSNNRVIIEVDEMCDDFIRLSLLFNPIVLPFSTIYYASKYFNKYRSGFIKFFKFIFVDIWVVFGTFIKNLFLIIYSDKRLLCALAALAGGLIGFYHEQPLLGGVLGGIIGIVIHKAISMIPKKESARV